MGHTLTKIVVHCVFSTKHRRAMLHADVAGRVDAYIAGIARNHDMHLLRAGGTEDHRHLLLQLRPTISLSDAIRLIKANSSKWVHDEFDDMGAFGWQNGYAAFSVSQSAMGRVSGYIDAQPEHHRTMTFQEELVALLQRHGIDCDPAHLWD